MEKLEQWLRTRPLAISLVLALIAAYVLSTNGVVSEDAMPFGDGEHYVMRGMLLYGYLHSGQWAKFWDLFTLPKQTLVLPHHLLFFLLPQSWASMTAYGICQVLVTYTLLALGVWRLCAVIDRLIWAPALYLLCASQNLSLDESYFYFVDTSFLAFGILVLSWQIQAWCEPSWRNSLISGATLALTFWLKPSNSVLFIGTYGLAEIFRIALVWFASRRDGGPKLPWSVALIRHFAAVTAGFLPVIILAIFCGGLQVIMLAFNTTESTGFFTTKLECTGLLRLFYFPLCLTYFYHTITVLVLFGIAGLVAYKWSRDRTDALPATVSKTSPLALSLMPILGAYFIAGELFSFVMAYKSMRYMLIEVPILWLAVFWLLEKWRLRPGLVFLAAAAYVLCGYSQILFNSYETHEVNAEGFQLKDDWLSRFPACHVPGNSGMSMTKGLLDFIHQALPDGGRVAVGTEQLYLTEESLSWASQYGPALHGQSSPYQFNNFLTVDGQYCRKSLLHARALLVIMHPAFQYSRAVYDGSIALVNFASGAWSKDGTVQLLPIRPGEKQDPIGYLIVTKEPLTDAQISEMMAGTHAPELSPEVDFGLSVDRRFTWQDGWNLLMEWKRRRLGGSAP